MSPPDLIRDNCSRGLTRKLCQEYIVGNTYTDQQVNNCLTFNKSQGRHFLNEGFGGTGFTGKYAGWYSVTLTNDKDNHKVISIGGLNARAVKTQVSTTGAAGVVYRPCSSN